MPKQPQTSRRTFLQLSSAALAAPWVGAHAQEAGANKPQPQASPGPVRAEGQPMPDGVKLPKKPAGAKRKDSVGFAVVGLGGYALKQMLPRFKDAEGAHLAALVSGNSDKLNKVADAYGVAEDARYSYDNFDRIAEDDRVDAVYIVLPSALHAEWAEKAFAAGKHVLCEKPMALNSEECQRMIRAARRADRKLMIAYRSHFEPFNLRAMELTGSNAIGQVRLIRTNQEYRMGPTTPDKNWRVNRALAGGGPLEDLGIYGLQAALYLSGEMPSAISARTFQPEGDPRFAEIFAHVGATLKFPSGAIAQIFSSYDSHGINRVMVNGTEGRLVMDPATSYSGQTMVLEKGKRETQKPGDPQVQFAAQLDHLADAIRKGSEIKTSGEMGLRDIRLIEAIYKAAAEDRVVQLKPDGTMAG